MLKKININKVNETLYYEKLPNGLEVFLLPNKKVKNFYLTFNTKFGSVYTEFKKSTEKSYKSVPNGVAHFLEHLTFKMEDMDASDYFAKLGSSSNAYTSFYVTCYEVFGFNKLKENLEYLLDYVQTPFYNEKNVEAEKGIINEEIRMYEDNVSRSLVFELYKMLFHNEKQKYLVSGTKEDVNNTTLKDIKTVYSYFYHPSNMFVIATGNFNPDEVMAIIEENQNKKKFTKPFKITTKKIHEEDSVVKKNKVVYDNVVIDKVMVGVKIPLKKFKDLKLGDKERRIYSMIILNSNFGRSSKLQQELKSANIITSPIYISRMETDSHFVYTFMVETNYPKRVVTRIKETIANLELDESDFIRKKKVAISDYIMSFDDIESVNDDIQSDIINFDKVELNRYDTFEDLKYETAKKIIKRLISKNIAVVTLTNKDKTK